MKKSMFLLVALVTVFISSAQTEKAFPKTISVTGSAELEIVPDEIYVQVELKEYEKKGAGKIDLETIKREFLSRVRSLGIKDSLVSIASYDGYNANPWLRKKKKEELMATIAYQLKLKTSQQVDALVNALDDQATQNFFISRTSHSRMEEFRKQLKISAIRAAKEKAVYLAGALDEKIGETITINEPTEHTIMPYNMYANTMMRDKESMDAGNVDFRQIKIKYEVNVVFALK